MSFAIDDVTVNLIDTPGHPDFIAEVERVLAVLDGAVLVVSAVEGVQAQTPLLWRALERLRVPTLFFVNKTDREGADPERVVAAIKERLTPAAVPVRRRPPVRARGERRGAPGRYVEGRGVDEEPLRRALAAQARSGLVHPVFAGSALQRLGFEELMAGIPELLPSQAGDEDEPLSGTVFKIERDDAGQKIAYARLFSGAIRVRDRLGDEKVTALAGIRGRIGRPAEDRRSGARSRRSGDCATRGSAMRSGCRAPSARTQFPPADAARPWCGPRRRRTRRRSTWR